MGGAGRNRRIARPAARLLAVGCLGLLACTDVSSVPKLEGVYLTMTSPASILIPQLGRFQIEAHVKSVDGRLLSDTLIHYEAAPAGIVQVSSGGLVESSGPSGIATVTIAAGSQQKSVTVTVRLTPGSVSLSTDSVSVQIGDTATVSGVALDVTGTVIPQLLVEYVVADTTIARPLNAHGPLWLLGQRVGRTEIRAIAAGVPAPTVIPVETTRDTAIIARIPCSGSPQSVAMTPYGAFITVRGHEFLIRFDPATLTVSDSLPLPQRAPLDVVASPDGATLFVTEDPFNLEQGVRVVDAATLGELAFIPLAGSPVMAAVHPDGTTLFVTAESAPEAVVYAIDIPSRAVRDSIDVAAVMGFPYGVVGLDVHPDGSRLYVSTLKGIMVFDAHTLAFVERLAIGSANVRVDPVGDELWVAGPPLGVVDLASSVPSTVPLAAGGSGFALGVDPAGRYVYVGRTCAGFTWPYNGSSYCSNYDAYNPMKVLSIVNGANRQEVQTIRTTGWPGGIGFAPNGLVIIPNRAGWIDVIRAH